MTHSAESPTNTPETVDLHALTEELLATLDARSKDIITRRFGLKSDRRETLESIGKEYGITRERVRQIESNAKKALSALDDILSSSYSFFSRLFASHGGALAEDHVVEIAKESLHQDISLNVIHFHLDILPDFTYVTSAKLFDAHWRHQPSLNPHIEEIVTAARDLLKKNNHPMRIDALIKETQSAMAAQGHEVDNATTYAALMASRYIGPTVFDEWGLVGWAETSPRGVGDKAYAVLRRHEKPAHFREITDLINNAKFDHKKANPQTVHNELIKDSRFVLVGRGLYGLKEWGYMTGTVADVLENILRDSEKPLSREELIDEVLKQRFVKKNTILLSLQNNRRFRRTNENRYTLQGK